MNFANKENFLNSKPFQNLPNNNQNDLAPYKKRFSVDAIFSHQTSPSELNLRIHDLNQTTKDRYSDNAMLEVDKLGKIIEEEELKVSTFGKITEEEAKGINFERKSKEGPTEKKVDVNKEKVYNLVIGSKDDIRLDRSPLVRMSNAQNIEARKDGPIEKNAHHIEAQMRDNTKERMSNAHNLPNMIHEQPKEQDKSSDPLIKYRSAEKLFKKGAEPKMPKEINVNSNKNKKLILGLVFMFVVLMLFNSILLGGKVGKNEVKEMNDEQVEENDQKMGNIQKVYDSSSEKINESYKRLGYQIYQRIKVQVQTHKSISLNKLEQDLDERYGEALREKIWPIVTSFRNEENEIVEIVEGDEKIWIFKEEN